MELASSQPDASTILPTQLTVLFGRKVSVSDEIEQKRFGPLDHILLSCFFCFQSDHAL